MILPNQHPDHRKPLDPIDAETLGVTAAEEVERHLTHRDNHAPTPLHALPTCADELGVGAIHIKDEGFRLGLGSFKALGGMVEPVGIEPTTSCLQDTRSAPELRPRSMPDFRSFCMRRRGGPAASDTLRSSSRCQRTGAQRLMIEKYRRRILPSMPRKKILSVFSST